MICTPAEIQGLNVVHLIFPCNDLYVTKMELLVVSKH